jgi:hypothetical protein
MMRRILVDVARARVTDKRGGLVQRVNLDDIPDVSSGRDRELVRDRRRVAQTGPR